MREIEFRGKTAKGEWVYGSYYKQEHFYGDEEEVHCIITTKDVLSNDLGLDYEEVIPETIGQYVGITDKNGKKVYEGDRVKVTYIEKRQYQGVPYDDEHCLTEEVFYSEENACFMLKVMFDDIPMYRPLHNFESLAKIKEIEVIGTIFDKESDNGD